MNLNRLEQILARAASRRITVIGDLMLDEFVWGKVGRISPEAPVPVVEVTGESLYPGGAANVARNLREFIDHVSVIGMLGNDRSGRQLRELLTVQNIDTSDAIEDESFCTIVKTRIIALHQQVVRVDREKIVALPAAQIPKVVAAVRNRIRETDAIIFEDYGKGFVTSELVAQIAHETRTARKMVAADPNPRHCVDWRGVTAVKPNRVEAFLAAGIPWRETQVGCSGASPPSAGGIGSGRLSAEEPATAQPALAANFGQEHINGPLCGRLGGECVALDAARNMSFLCRSS